MENEELIKAAEQHTKITIPSDYHSTYKEAESACIHNLIEIVKSKKQ